MTEFLVVVISAAFAFVGWFLLIIAHIVFFIVAAISGVFMIGALFSFGIWLLTGQRDAILAMLDFLVWGAISFIPITIFHYYMDKWLNPDPKKLSDGRYELARLTTRH